jgi:hypothetical protein
MGINEDKFAAALVDEARAKLLPEFLKFLEELKAGSITFIGTIAGVTVHATVKLDPKEKS